MEFLPYLGGAVLLAIGLYKFATPSWRRHADSLVNRYSAEFKENPNGAITRHTAIIIAVVLFLLAIMHGYRVDVIGNGKSVFEVINSSSLLLAGGVAGLGLYGGYSALVDQLVGTAWISSRSILRDNLRAWGAYGIAIVVLWVALKVLNAFPDSEFLTPVMVGVGASGVFAVGFQSLLPIWGRLVERWEGEWKTVAGLIGTVLVTVPQLT